MKKIFRLWAMPVVLLIFSFLIFILCYYVFLMAQIISEWVITGTMMMH